MSQVAISGNAAGTGVFTIASPNSNSSYTLTLPTATTTVVGTDATQTLTNKTITGAVMSSMASSVITSGTAVATTSGTSIDFTSLPSWVKRITVMFNGVSTTGTSAVIIQLGSGSVTTTGYLGAGNNAASGAGWTIANFTTGLTTSFDSDAARTRYGFIQIVNVTGNTWVSSTVLANSASTSMSVGAGGITLGGTLDRVRMTTVNGTDTFDAGSINILYE